ncbi:uncharacterized protein LOC113470059 [Diaphorina citri]|uniref:Uncharacterized protein LOC113470059 n=1 Tax=Diaphorina citri TaxID=121845 RepID=A0A3Q0J6A4_DIACI|nr:uncharacterized protein LOC113470059 [Diaphorina citri]
MNKYLIEAVITSTRHLVNNFSSEQISNTSKIALNTLCPALYALLNEGGNSPSHGDGAALGVRSLHESLSLLGKLPPISPIHSVSSSIGSLRTSWTLKKLIRSIQSSSEEESELTMGHIRPRSCIDSANYLSNDVASSAKKRWSTINMGSKLAVAFQSLGGEEDEYPDR